MIVSSFSSTSDVNGTVRIRIDVPTAQSWAVGAVFMGSGNQGTAWGLDFGSGIVGFGVGVGSFVNCGVWSRRQQVSIVGVGCPVSSLMTVAVFYEFADEVPPTPMSMQWVPSPSTAGVQTLIPTGRFGVAATGAGFTGNGSQVLAAPGPNLAIALFECDIRPQNSGNTGNCRMLGSSSGANVLLTKPVLGADTTAGWMTFNFGGLQLGANQPLFASITVAADNWQVQGLYAIAPVITGLGSIAGV